MPDHDCRPCFGLVWSSWMTIGYRAARRAARYGDGFGADCRPSNVNYESLPSLIGRFEGSGRSGSSRSFDCRIVIRWTRSDSQPSNRSVGEFLRFRRFSVSRGVSARTTRAHPVSYGTQIELHCISSNIHSTVRRHPSQAPLGNLSSSYPWLIDHLRRPALVTPNTRV